MVIKRWHRPEMTTWSPVQQLSTLREEIDRLFDSPLQEFTRGSQQLLSGWLPPVDLYEDKDHLMVVAELPGMAKEQIAVSLQHDLLTLSGERKQDEKIKEAEISRAERFLGRFQRTISLPVAVNPDQVKASYKEGILTITLPKAEEAKPRQIQVNVA
jgi:HSP20 family protein